MSIHCPGGVETRIGSHPWQILAVPATSIPSERVLSTADLVVSKLQNRLSSKIVDKVVVVVLLLKVHSHQLWSWWDGQLT